MLTKLRLRNFKLFEDVEIELADRVIFVGPNNSGKTSALQALALWNTGVRRWVERRGAGNVPKKRSAVTINRRDLISLPVPTANLLWRDLHVREGYKEAGKQKTRNVRIEIDVDGIDRGKMWATSLEFDYANEESFYCRSRLDKNGKRLEIPVAAAKVDLAYLPPMSGLASNETRLDEGAGRSSHWRGPHGRGIAQSLLAGARSIAGRVGSARRAHPGALWRRTQQATVRLGTRRDRHVIQSLHRHTA